MERSARPLLLARSLSELRKACDLLEVCKIGNKIVLVDRILKQMSTSVGRKAAFKDPYLCKFYSAQGPIEPMKVLQCYCALSFPSNQTLSKSKISEKHSSGHSTKPSSSLVSCKRCGNLQHRECIELNYKIKPYVCASCQLHQQDPFEAVHKEIIDPFFVVLASQSRPMRFIFDALLDRTHFELQMRCVRIDEAGYGAHWPSWGSVSVNGVRIKEFKTPPNLNSKRRKDSAINLTSYILKGDNSIEVNKSNDDAAYVAGIYLIEKVSERQLIEKYIASPHISRDASIAAGKI